MEVIVLAIAFATSVVGAICGIGGGVIIKPLLDTLGIADIAEISFLSGCTVLSMAFYSFVKNLVAKESMVNFKSGTPLAIGAAVGGIGGKYLFSLLSNMAAQSEQVGGYQAICLTIITSVTLIYTLNKQRIKTMQLKNTVACVLIGLILGVISSFLGIGGGPINLMVLYFFFSMKTKEAAQNSLYIILISQISSLMTSIVTDSVPQFHIPWLIVMIIGGIAGGMVGRKVNKKLNSAMVYKLFVGLLIVIIGISCYNAWRFLKT